MFDLQEELLLKRAFASYHRALAAALPCEEELEPINLSERLEKRIKRLLYHQKHFYYTWINTAAKRVACILTAVLSIGTIAAVGIGHLNATNTNFDVETYEGGTTYVFHSRTRRKGDPFVHKAPAYIPAGYTLIEDKSDANETGLVYEGKGLDYLFYGQYESGMQYNVKTKDITYQSITAVGEYEGYIFENEFTTLLLFNDGEYLYLINGTLSREELYLVAESIVGGEEK